MKKSKEHFNALKKTIFKILVNNESFFLKKNLYLILNFSNKYLFFIIEKIFNFN